MIKSLTKSLTKSMTGPRPSPASAPPARRRPPPGGWPAWRRQKARLWGMPTLLVCLLFVGMGQSLFFVILPPAARDLGLSEFQTSIIFSLSALFWVVCSPLWGRASDAWGRKPVILIGVSGFAASTALVALTIHTAQTGLLPAALLLPTLIATRAIFGGFGSGSMAAAQAYIADRTRRRRRASGVSALTAAFGSGNILGPGVAASLIVFGFLTPFLVVSGLAVAGIVMLALFLAERPPRSTSARRGMASGPLPARIVAPFLTLGVMISFAHATLLQLASFYFIDRLELGLDEAGQIIAVSLMIMAFATLFAQLVLIQSFNLPIQVLLRLGAVCMIAAFAGLAGSETYGTLTAALALAGVGFGLLRPGMMAAASLAAPPDRQGRIAGLLNSTAACGHMINPFTGAILYQYWIQGPFVIAGVIMAACLAVILFNPVIRAIRAEIDPRDHEITAPHHAPHRH